jgi:SOS-response transcriptional repressor LexA
MQEKKWEQIPLTKKQEDVYVYVAGYITDEGYAPTRREIVAKLCISEQAVSAHLREIKNKGWIKFTSGGWRNIELIEEGIKPLMVGRITVPYGIREMPKGKFFDDNGACS